MATYSKFNRPQNQNLYDICFSEYMQDCNLADISVAFIKGSVMTVFRRSVSFCVTTSISVITLSDTIYLTPILFIMSSIAISLNLQFRQITIERHKVELVEDDIK